MVSKKVEYLSGLEESTPEAEYHSALFDIFGSQEGTPQVKDCGLALILVLSRFDFLKGTVDSRIHPVAGSDHENCRILPFLFPTLKCDEQDWFYSFQTTDYLTYEKYLDYWKEILAEKSEKIW